MALSSGNAVGSGRRHGRRRAVMSEINVTPMVDVMLVLLIIDFSPALDRRCAA